MNRSLRLLRPAALGVPLRAGSKAFSTSTIARIGLPAHPTLTSSQPQKNITNSPMRSVRFFSSPSSPRLASSGKKDDKAAATKGKAADAKKGDALAAGAKGEKGDANYSHSEQGIIEGAVGEARAIAHDVVDMISGRSATHPTAFSGSASAVTPGSTKGGPMSAMETVGHGSVTEDFSSITKGLVLAIPEHIRKFGLLGTVPYIGTAVGTVFLAREASQVEQGLSPILGMKYGDILSSLHTLEEIQITYGAVILSFLGALHWGMEFTKYGGEQGYSRLMLGTLPVLFAWPTTFMSHGIALAFQWTAFTTTWFLDQRASSNGWTPPWFATYRFYLSIIVGFSIIGTLSGTSYYGFGSGSDVAGVGAGGEGYAGIDKNVDKRMRRQGMNSLHEVATSPKSARKGTGRKGGDGSVRGTTTGDVYVEEEEGLEAYGRLKNKTKAAEEAEEEEEEEEEGEGEVTAKEDEGGEADDEDKGEEKKDDGDDDKSEGESGDEEKGAAGEKNTRMR